MGFLTLDIAGRALAAQQLAIEVSGNNLANATTPGYRRETANLVESPPFPDPALSGQPMGTGVSVSTVTRATNAFLARAVRSQYGLTGQWQTVSQNLTQIQSLFQEPSSGGLAESLASFFSAWLTVSQNPTNLAARQAVLEQGTNLANLFHSMSRQILAELQNVNQTVTSQVAQINSLGSQIAALNHQISIAQASGGPANTLLDQRGALLDQLSQLTQVSYTVSPASGALNVYLGSSPLVVNTQVDKLTTQAPSGSSPGMLTPGWQVSPTQFVALNPSSGALKGSLDTWTHYLSYYLGQLNTLADNLGTAVNAVYANGSPSGQVYFTGLTGSATSAQTLAVNPNLTASQLVVSSSTNPGPGNGQNALAIANLQSQTQTALGATFSGYYTSLVGRVGVDGQNANAQLTSSQASLTALRNARQGATGVDVNQASIQLIAEQQGYVAAAKLVAVEQSTINSLLQAVS